jgi:hypothetical protein
MDKEARRGAAAHLRGAPFPKKKSLARWFWLWWRRMRLQLGGQPQLSLLGLLLAADLVYIAVHLAYTPRPGWNLYDLSQDRSYAESYQYLKWYWIVLMLAATAISRRSPLHASWMLLFLYLAIDDSFQIHEGVGEHLGKVLGLQPPWGMRPQDLGELLVSGSAAAFLLAPIAFFHRAAAARDRLFSQDLVVMLLTLAFFGIFVDMVHVIADGGGSGQILDLVEDGGEMIVSSVIACAVGVECLGHARRSFS